MNLIIYTNILTPYRKYFYDLLYKTCNDLGYQFRVLVMAETEKGRKWKYDDLKAEYTILLNSKTIDLFGFSFHYNNNISSTLKRLHPDILVCAGGYDCPGVWTSLLLKNKLKYKCLFWSESHLNDGRNNSKIKIYIREVIRKIIYQRFDGFWYAGVKSKEFCEKYAKPVTKYYFVPNLINEKQYLEKVDEDEKHTIRLKLNIEENKNVIILPASLIPRKGILEFLEIIKNSKCKDKFVIVIAGEGELKDEIAKTANLYKIDVRLLGYKQQEEMIKLYAISDIFLMPSLLDANPLTCIEALWEGLPLFISEHCGNYPELVRQGSNGYVFSYKDLEGTLKMFDEMISRNADWRKSAGAMSLEIAQKLYQSEDSAKRIILEMREEC